MGARERGGGQVGRGGRGVGGELAGKRRAWGWEASLGAMSLEPVHVVGLELAYQVHGTGVGSGDSEEREKGGLGRWSGGNESRGKLSRLSEGTFNSISLYLPYTLNVYFSSGLVTL